MSLRNLQRGLKKLEHGQPRLQLTDRLRDKLPAAHTGQPPTSERPSDS